MEIEWKPEQTHPLLILDDRDLCIRLQSLEYEYGGNPSIRYQLEVSLAHTYGSVIYRTSFLSLTLDSLKVFSLELKNSYDDPSQAIVFSDLVQEFVLRIVKQDRSCQIFLELKWFGIADVSLTSGSSDRDTMQLWSRRLDEHCKLMDQWMIENPPIGPA